MKLRLIEMKMIVRFNFEKNNFQNIKFICE